MVASRVTAASSGRLALRRDAHEFRFGGCLASYLLGLARAPRPCGSAPSPRRAGSLRVSAWAGFLPCRRGRNVHAIVALSTTPRADGRRVRTRAPIPLASRERSALQRTIYCASVSGPSAMRVEDQSPACRRSPSRAESPAERREQPRAVARAVGSRRLSRSPHLSLSSSQRRRTVVGRESIETSNRRARRTRWDAQRLVRRPLIRQAGRQR